MLNIINLIIWLYFGELNSSSVLLYFLNFFFKELLTSSNFLEAESMGGIKTFSTTIWKVSSAFYIFLLFKQMWVKLNTRIWILTWPSFWIFSFKDSCFCSWILIGSWLFTPSPSFSELAVLIEISGFKFSADTEGGWTGLLLFWLEFEFWMTDCSWPPNFGTAVCR